MAGQGDRVEVVRRHSGPLRIAVALALALIIGGCAAFGSKPPPTFDLTAATGFPPHGGAPHGQLIVGEPTALAILDTERIVVRPAKGELGYLGGAQWSDRLPKLVQARIVQSFENANRLRAVGRAGERLTADFDLVIDMRAFGLALADNGTFAEVEISAKVVADKSGRIIAGKVFRVTIPAASSEGPAATAALDEAFHRVVIEMVLWAVRLA
jgi:cholesterol transport system auxiliary component